MYEKKIIFNNIEKKMGKFLEKIIYDIRNSTYFSVYKISITNIHVENMSF